LIMGAITKKNENQQLKSNIEIISAVYLFNEKQMTDFTPIITLIVLPAFYIFDEERT